MKEKGEIAYIRKCQQDILRNNNILHEISAKGDIKKHMYVYFVSENLCMHCNINCFKKL